MDCLQSLILAPDPITLESLQRCCANCQRKWDVFWATSLDSNMTVEELHETYPCVGSGVADACV